MLLAVEHLGVVGVGVTAARFFRADDGRIYVVKLQNNRLGCKVLVSELLAAKLGEIMGLCFPPSSLIMIDEKLLHDDLSLAAAGVTPGPHFASQYLEGAQYLGRHDLAEVVNTHEMAGVMLFDHLFHNADRGSNKKNVLLLREGSGYRIYAIDNSHLFRAGRWTIKSLERLRTKKKVYWRRSFGLLLREYLSAESFRPYVDRITRLADGDIADLVGGVPPEWLPDEVERQALADFIKVRRDMAPQIWGKLCRHIPRSRGGSRRLRGKVIRLSAWASTEDTSLSGTD